MKITWLGQAGYLLRAENGTTVMIDPYLSDSLYEARGASHRREVPIDPAYLTKHIDVLVLTHLHGDHTDFGTLDQLLAANGPVSVLAPLNVLMALQKRYTYPEKYMLFDRGIEITLNGILFRSTYAAHSDERPIGVVIEGDGKVICHTGDTMYHRQLLEDLPRQADALLLPINGWGYNMNAVDAARLTRTLEPRAVYPMHWDMFKTGGCDVEDFVSLFASDSPRIVIPAYYSEITIE